MNMDKWEVLEIQEMPSATTSGQTKTKAMKLFLSLTCGTNHSAKK